MCAYKCTKPWIRRGFVDEASPPAAVHPASDIHVDKVAQEVKLKKININELDRIKLLHASKRFKNHH